MADFRHSGLQSRRISATRRNFSAPLRLRAEIFRPPCSAPPRKKFEKFTSLGGGILPLSFYFKKNYRRFIQLIEFCLVLAEIVLDELLKWSGISKLKISTKLLIIATGEDLRKSFQSTIEFEISLRKLCCSRKTGKPGFIHKKIYFDRYLEI